MSIALRWQDTEEEMETVYNTYKKYFRSKNILRASMSIALQALARHGRGDGNRS